MNATIKLPEKPVTILFSQHVKYESPLHFTKKKQKKKNGPLVMD